MGERLRGLTWQVLPNGTVWLTELIAMVAGMAQAGAPWTYKASEAQARRGARAARRPPALRGGVRTLPKALRPVDSECQARVMGLQPYVRPGLAL